MCIILALTRLKSQALVLLRIDIYSAGQDTIKYSVLIMLYMYLFLNDLHITFHFISSFQHWSSVKCTLMSSSSFSSLFLVQQIITNFAIYITDTENRTCFTWNKCSNYYCTAIVVIKVSFLNSNTNACDFRRWKKVTRKSCQCVFLLCVMLVGKWWSFA